MINVVQKTKQFLADNFLRLDNKISVLIPNPKLKKILYIGVGSLFGFMFLIITLGLLLSPLRKTNQAPTININKPNIVNNQSSKPEAELTENQKLINNYAKIIRETSFPPTTLNIPIIERGLSI